MGLTNDIYSSYTVNMREQTAEIPLGTIETYGTLSGYIYLHISQHLCKQFGIQPKTVFIAYYSDGKLVLKQDGKIILEQA